MSATINFPLDQDMEEILRSNSNSLGLSSDMQAMLGLHTESSSLLQVPQTPQKRINQGLYPITPESMARSHSMQHVMNHNNLNEEAIFNTTPMKRASSFQDTIGEKQQVGLTSRPISVAALPSTMFDRAQFPSYGYHQLADNNAVNAAHSTRIDNQFTPTTPFESCPDLTQRNVFLASGGNLYDFGDAQADSAAPNDSDTPPAPSSPKKRKTAAKVKEAAPDYLPLAIIRDTGVTVEQIAAYIGLPLDEKPTHYRCLWPECTQTNPRKENIKSHVQTHLDDRAFECPDCHKPFVRPHDFTRHYATHANLRPFKCPGCWQGFNRADALQRHRERDFCDGGCPGRRAQEKDGAETKRGRPKKSTTSQPKVRRQKKEQLRKQTKTKPEAIAFEQSVDDFYSSASSPEYLHSGSTSPEADMFDFDDVNAITSVSACCPSGYAPAKVQMDDVSELAQQLLTVSGGIPATTPPASPLQNPTLLHSLKRTLSNQSQTSHNTNHSRGRVGSMSDFFAGEVNISIHGLDDYSAASSPPELSTSSPSPTFSNFTNFNDFGDSDFNTHSFGGPQLLSDHVASTYCRNEWFDPDTLFQSLDAGEGMNTDLFVSV